MPTHDVEISPTVVLKRFRTAEDREPDREWAALQLLARYAPDTAPLPIRRIADSVTMSRMPGTSLAALAGDTGTRTDVTAALGRVLRTMWSVPIPDDMPERHLGPSVMPRVVVDRLRALPAGARGAAAGPSVPAAVDAAVALLRTTDLTSTAPPVLGIADGNPENVLVEGDVCRLVDFEAAGRSDVGYELAEHLEHVAIRRPGRAPLLRPDDLLDAVDATREERARYATCRLSLAACWLELLLPGRPGAARNPPGSAEHQARHVLDLVAAGADHTS